ncbi:MAG: PSD1 and planctomycete cytochrome C domain-containing protein [Verrucomicrobiales bacterium]|nr:PSD1 and planctomycete cytochrome C domain-containing protein [Verrucomicrobiales bacterium]
MFRINFYIVTIILAQGSLSADVWDTDIAPIFQSNCVKCHGGAKKKGGLDLRSYESLLEGAESGPVIVHGSAEESELFRVVLKGSDPHMPPKGQLDEKNINDLRLWIDGLKKEPVGQNKSSPKFEIPEDISLEKAIDFALNKFWSEQGIEPSSNSSDEVFCRRVYLDVIGRIPSVDEVNHFLLAKSPNKRETLIDELLRRNEHFSYMAEIFNAILLGRESVTKKDRSEREKNGWLDYLEWVFRTNRPWDLVAKDLVLSRPNEGVESGSSWFLFEQKNDHSEMAKLTMSTLLGKRIECAQCHDHPVAPEIEQRHYWGMVSFFNRSINVQTNKGMRVAERATGGHSKYADLSGKSHSSELVLLGNEPIKENIDASHKDHSDLYVSVPPKEWFEKKNKDKKGYHLIKVDDAPVPKFSRRQKLIELAFSDKNPSFAEAFVNRVWALLLGRGIVHPVNLMDSAHPPSHPELLQRMGRDFANSGYNIRKLIRSILMSRTYHLSSYVSAKVKPLPQTFSYHIIKPISAEAFSKSILIAMGYYPDEHGEFRNVDAEKLRREFAAKFPDLFPEVYSPTVQQALYLSNNKTVEELFISDDNRTLSIIEKQDSDINKVRESFKLILGREPDPEEIKAGAKFLERGPDSLKHFCWALVSGSEFRMNR